MIDSLVPSIASPNLAKRRRDVSGHFLCEKAWPQEVQEKRQACGRSALWTDNAARGFGTPLAFFLILQFLVSHIILILHKNQP